jgi:hypothetical protein
MPWGKQKVKPSESPKPTATVPKDDACCPSEKLAQAALNEAAENLKTKILEMDPNAKVNTSHPKEIEAQIKEMLKAKKFDESKKSSAKGFLDWVQVKVLPIVCRGLNFAGVQSAVLS